MLNIKMASLDFTRPAGFGPFPPPEGAAARLSRAEPDWTNGERRGATFSTHTHPRASVCTYAGILLSYGSRVDYLIASRVDFFSLTRQEYLRAIVQTYSPMMICWGFFCLFVFYRGMRTCFQYVDPVLLIGLIVDTIFSLT